MKKKLLPDLKDKKVAIWGLAFKPKTDDMREDPAITIIKQLVGEEADVVAFDPEAMDNAKKIFKNIKYAENPYDAIKDADLLGIPIKIIIGKHWLEYEKYELQTRAYEKKVLVTKKDICHIIHDLLA